jgi:N-acetylneuraminate lyase
MRLHGLIAAPHTPFHADGSLNLAPVEQQAELLAADGVAGVFIGGSTGECHSLTVAERRALAERWAAVVRGSPLALVVHVGGNCLADARELARHAEDLDAAAIAALSPSYYKPATLDLLAACCAEIAGAAPSRPFYFYDIPSMTGVHHSMPDFLELAAERVPTLVGIKFTNPDLTAYLRGLRHADGRFDLPWGVDEALLGALAVGAEGGVGSSYNFAAPLYLRLIAAFRRGDLAAAREEQARSVLLIRTLSRFGYLPAARAVLGMLGVPVGPPRLPNAPLQGDETELRAALTAIGFFEWGR